MWHEVWRLNYKFKAKWLNENELQERLGGFRDDFFERKIYLDDFGVHEVDLKILRKFFKIDLLEVTTTFEPLKQLKNFITVSSIELKSTPGSGNEWPWTSKNSNKLKQAKDKWSILVIFYSHTFFLINVFMVTRFNIRF